MLFQRLLLHGVGVDEHRGQERRRCLGGELERIGIHSAHADFLRRHLAVDRLCPILDHALVVPREIPGVGRVGAILEGRDIVVGGDRRAVIPHQVGVELEGPDQAAVIDRPLGGCAGIGLEVLIQAYERVRQNVRECVGSFVDGLEEVDCRECLPPAVGEDQHLLVERGGVRRQFLAQRVLDRLAGCGGFRRGALFGGGCGRAGGRARLDQQRDEQQQRQPERVAGKAGSMSTSHSCVSFFVTSFDCRARQPEGRVPVERHSRRFSGFTQTVAKEPAIIWQALRICIQRRNAGVDGQHA